MSNRVSMRQRIKPFGAQIMLSPVTQTVARRVLMWRRRVSGDPRVVTYFHQVDDPYSHLLVQVLPDLAQRYEIELQVHLVPPPRSDAAPQPDLLRGWSRLDAMRLAERYGLAFAPQVQQPPHPQIKRAQTILAAVIAQPGFSTVAFGEAARRVGDALWKGDEAQLHELERSLGELDALSVERMLAEGDAARQAQGHYLGGMLHYEKEWYWGVDRLHYLEARLRGEGAMREPALRYLLEPPALPEMPGGEPRYRPLLEFFFSFRSPYSYLAIERTYALAERYPIELRIRPVLPMVMRGLPVPPNKTMYIALDSAREARLNGIPFGRIADPVGLGVERCMAVWDLARQKGQARSFMLSAARGIWSEGIHVVSDRGLRKVGERVGLAWPEMQAALLKESWRDWAEENRQALFGYGLWGVPCYAIDGDWVCWGQDRFETIETELRRRLAG